MKRSASLAWTVLAALLTAACVGDRMVGPAATDAAVVGLGSIATRAGHYNLPAPASDGIRVMGYNVYLGTNLGPLLTAQSPQEFLAAAYQAYAELQATDVPARAGKIADQIAAVQPDAIGLDEVGLWSVSEPYDPTQPPLVPFVVKYDFLELVLDSLAARGLASVPATADTTSDVAAPVPTAFDASGNPTAFALVRFQDRDAILVRAGVAFADPRHGKFSVFIPLDVMGIETGLYRGWCSVAVTVGGRAFRFVNAHPEAENGMVNYAQVAELVGILQQATEPIVWVGDFNTGPGSAADFQAGYALLLQAGFTDLWLEAHPRDPGLTNGSTDGVLVDSLVFDKRIDLVMVRDPNGPPEAAHASLFGDLPADRTASGLWPSDHAALGAVFQWATP